jgi:hypothetical protein
MTSDRKRSKEANCRRDEFGGLPVRCYFGTQRGVEGISNIDDRNSGNDRILIVPMHELVQSVQIAQAVPLGFAMLRHYGFGFASDAKVCRLQADKGALSSHRRLRSTWRSDDKVHIPFTRSDPDLSIQLVNNPSSTCVFPELRT